MNVKLSKYKNAALIAGGVTLGITALGATGIYMLASKMYNSIQPQPPTEEILENEKKNTKNNQLFILFPEMQQKLAWVSLGSFPSQINTLSMELPHCNKKIQIYLKREDLVNQEYYGGNKVRTLEYQLACAKIQLSNSKKKSQIEKTNTKTKSGVISLCGPGSNQIAAASVYGHKLDIPIIQCQFGDESSSFDNGLNFVSHMSFKDSYLKPFWAENGYTKIYSLYKLLINNPNNDLISMPGGNNVLGALGHVNAMLELANQFDGKEKEKGKGK